MQLENFEGADLKCDISFFFSSSQKIPKEFLALNLGIFLFHKILQLDKFDGADFKYNTIVFKFQPKNIQIRLFWSQILTIFIFAANFRQTLKQEKFKNADFKYANIFFSNSSLKIRKQSIFH